MTALYIVIFASLLLPLALVQSGSGSSLTVPTSGKANCARNSDEDAEF